MKTTLITLFIDFLILVVFCFPQTAQAADLDFSIYPTLVKTTIKPGKSISQVVTVTNSSATPHTFIVRVVPFVPIDNQGNPELKPNYKPAWLSFFGLANANISLNKPFKIEAGKSQQLTLTINVPEDAPLSDHYANLLAISSDQLGQNDDIPNTLVSGAIGMNILLTVSNQEFPRTSLSLTQFAPVSHSLLQLPNGSYFFDNLSPIKFSAVAKNIGRFLAEPHGLFKVVKGRQPIFLEPILPQNILANSERELQASPSGYFTFSPAITDIGRFTAVLSLNSETASASSQITFILFPFKAALALTATFILLFVLIRISRQTPP